MSKKITQDQFINECKNKHNNLYLYTNTLYTKMSDKIEIICPKHGIFYQKAQHHILGRGCSECSKNKKINKERLEKESISRYGNIFDYSESFFERRSDTIDIKHFLFGKFSQRLDTHILGKLPDRLKCLISIQEKIKKFKNIECSRYLNYKSNSFEIECHEHGWFEVNVEKTRSIKNINCKLCSNKKTIELLMRKIINSKYDYSMINEYNFKGVNKKMPIKCNDHGVFYQKLNNHIYLNQGCPKCNGGIKLDLEEIKNRTKFDIINYKNGQLIFNCQKHGHFKKDISKIQQGCPRCGNKSRGENKIVEILSKNGILFEQQKKFHDCKHKRNLRFDFYLPIQNICIEYDGIQHFESLFGDIEFENTIKRDNIKNEYCQKNNIKLLRIPYTDFEKISKKTWDKYKIGTISVSSGTFLVFSAFTFTNPNKLGYSLCGSGVALSVGGGLYWIIGEQRYYNGKMKIFGNKSKLGYRF